MSDLKAPSKANDLIPQRVTFPSEFSTNDVDIWRSLNLSGRREGPLYVEEPDFVVRSEEEDHHAHLFGTHILKESILYALKGVIDLNKKLYLLAYSFHVLCQSHYAQQIKMMYTKKKLSSNVLISFNWISGKSITPHLPT